MRCAACGPVQPPILTKTAPLKNWRGRPRKSWTAVAMSAPSLAEKLVAQLDQPIDKPLHEPLSDREHEVMKMIASGVPLTEIGEPASCQRKND